MIRLRVRPATVVPIHLLAILAGAATALDISLIGRVYLSELILVLVLSVHLRSGTVSLSWPTRLLIPLAYLWLCSLVLSDLVRLSAPHDFLRGWAEIGFLVVNLLALEQFRVRGALLPFATGFALSYFLDLFISPTEKFAADPTRFGLGGAVALLVCCLLEAAARSRPNDLRLWRGTAAVLLSGGGVVYLAGGLRSQAGVMLLAATTIFVSSWRSAKPAKPTTAGRRVIRNALSAGAWIVLAGLGALTLYGWMADVGALGERSAVQFEHQAAGQYGILIGGRSEVLVGLEAVGRSPWVGHGSWARDEELARRVQDVRVTMGYAAGPPPEYDLIPSHSHIVGAWVEAGVGSVPFWVAVLVLTISNLGRFLTDRTGGSNGAGIVGIYAAVTLLWSVPFSPFAAEARIALPLTILLASGASHVEAWPRRRSRGAE